MGRAGGLLVHGGWTARLRSICALELERWRMQEMRVRVRHWPLELLLDDRPDGLMSSLGILDLLLPELGE